MRIRDLFRFREVLGKVKPNTEVVIKDQEGNTFSLESLMLEGGRLVISLLATKLLK